MKTYIIEDLSEHFSFFRGLHLLGKTVFGRFSCFFRGFFVALIWGIFCLRVLALEKSFEPRDALRAMFWVMLSVVAPWRAWKC